ncbi:MAG: hypothetical protein M3N43_06500 [Actinomycetota bacterium]|nr:hypothetical protein [Actinomycetota bacterium]
MAVTWRGVKLDAQTRDILVEVDKLVGPYIPIRPTQGSYSTSVGASAGTHAGGGAVDLSTRDMSPWQIELVVFLLRRTGCAAWHRAPSEGDWASHVHAINKTARDLSPQAKRQVDSYMAGKNGLASNKPDKHAALEAPRESTWKSYCANWPDR